MRSSWYFRPPPKPSASRVAMLIFGLVVVVFYFVRRVLVALHVGGWSQEVDAPVNTWVLEHQNAAAHGFAEVMHLWGATPGMTTTMILVALALILWTRSLWPLVTIAFTATGSVLTTILLKTQLQQQRPDGIPGGLPPPDSFSFPSGHTLNAAALIGIAAYLTIVYGAHRWRYAIGAIAVIFILAMGASRVYLAHHWVSDVVIGLAIGAGWSAIVAILHFYFVPRKTPVPRNKVSDN